jgi:hypothetical protein
MPIHEPSGLDQHQREIIKLIRENARRQHLHEVFRDFCEMAALAFSNSCDLTQRTAREARYLEIVGRYTKEEVQRFTVMLARIVESLQHRFHDCLGAVFMALELGDHWKGQFFTPYPVAYLMAKIGGSSRVEVEGNGFVTLQEPACGAGCMVIAAAQAMHDEGIAYQQRLHVTAIDIDQTAAHMAYIQLTLLHIPAIVVHGNALWPGKGWSNWVTLAHVMGGWDRKLAQAYAAQASADEVAAPPEPEPQAFAHVDELQPAAGVPVAVDLANVRAEVVAARVEQLALF